MTILLLSIGTPMLAMGDVIGRSQQGNNNAYAQDNSMSWIDWRLLERNTDLHRYVRKLIAHRGRRDVVINESKLTLCNLVQRYQIGWHGVEPNQPDWSESFHSFGVTTTSLDHRFRWHAMVNAWWEPLTFQLPTPDAGELSWQRWIDTSQASPYDINPRTSAPSLEVNSYTVVPRSVVVLIAGLSEVGTGSSAGKASNL